MMNELLERYPSLQICKKDIEDALRIDFINRNAKKTLTNKKNQHI